MHNRLLASLSPAALSALAPHLERIVLDRGARLFDTGLPGVRVCFPETLVVSFCEVHADGQRCHTGMIGHEGMIGWPCLLGADRPTSTAVVQLGGGTALVMPAATLLALVDRHRDLHCAFLRFVQTFTIQLSQTIVATLRDGVSGRLARWLLMLHDRIDGDLLPITHGELAAALNVRRSSVTDCLHILEGDGVLRCTRGEIVVRDRAALERVAGRTYGPAEDSYRALIGPFGKSTAKDAVFGALSTLTLHA